MRNLKKILLAASILVSVMTSCTDYEKLEFEVEKPDGIASQELINEYDGLKDYLDTVAYPNFRLGADLNLATYTDQALTYRLVNSNFNQITFTEGMQHGDIVKGDGSFDFSGLESLFQITQSIGMAVYGKDLVSNNRQNADYLNGLLENIIIENPVYPNSLSKIGLNDASFTNWVYTSGADMSVIDFNGLQTVKMVSAANASSSEDLRLTTPEINVVQGHEYEVIMFVRSDSDGTGRISFEGLANNTPEIDWDGSGTASNNFSTDVKWKKIQFRISDFTSDIIKLHLDFGYHPNTTYYINIGSLYVYDTQATVGSKNVWLEAECGNVGSLWNEYSDRPSASGGKYIMIPDTGTQNNDPGTKVGGNITFDFNVSETGDYTLFVRSAADNASNDSFHVKVDDGGWTTVNGPLNHVDFLWNQVVKWNLSSGSHKMTVAMREDGLRLDKFYITLDGDDPGATDANNLGDEAFNCMETGFDLVRTPEEKTALVEEHLNSWITSVVSYSKDFVKTWNVVDEPMDDENPYEVKSGENIQHSEAFYWQDYLGGKDYGVKAFQWARDNGNIGDLLFISDYGLDTNMDKCKGLIQYVEYLENQGAQVDGIGAKMHLTINSDKAQIASVFQLLAATGKQIAIADLYVQTLTDSPTEQTLVDQANMYHDAVQAYLDNVPTSQRYGITVRGIKDNASNSSWLPGDKLGLWDVNYVRKPAYAGFSESLKLLKN